MAYVDEAYREERIIFILWTHKLPNISTHDFCLWENSKGKVYNNNLHIVEDLKMNIHNLIMVITQHDSAKFSFSTLRCENLVKSSS